MHDTHELCERIGKLTEQIASTLEYEFSKGCSAVDTCEASKVVDMLKDFCQAEYYLKKAQVEEVQMSRVHRLGYPLYPDYPNEYSIDDLKMKMRGVEPFNPNHDRMGYPMPAPTISEARPEFGHEFERYRQSLRHYTETKSDRDRQDMHDHGKKHVMEAVTTMKEIWRDADPELRKQMRDACANLMNDFK